MDGLLHDHLLVHRHLHGHWVRPRDVHNLGNWIGNVFRHLDRVGNAVRPGHGHCLEDGHRVVFDDGHRHGHWLGHGHRDGLGHWYRLGHGYYLLDGLVDGHFDWDVNGMRYSHRLGNWYHFWHMDYLGYGHCLGYVNSFVDHFDDGWLVVVSASPASIPVGHDDA